MASFAEVEEQARRTGKLYEDTEFLAVDDSLFFSKKPPRPFVWKRPKEICDDPKFVIGAPSRFDVMQGMLGNDWFLAPIVSLVDRSKLFNDVIPPDQNFVDNYCGAFKFNLAFQGQWIEIVVDDRLPTYNNKLVFTHSSHVNVFWSALFEKAYAKLHGSYEALRGGQSIEAMVDFTQGLGERVHLGAKTPEGLFARLQKSYHRESLMCCSIEAKPNEIESKDSLGLIKGHAYTVTGVITCTARTRSGNIEVELLRVRNPWGNEREWKGAWGDQSGEWSLLSESEKKKFGLTFDADGEFWMSLKDFCQNFTLLEICELPSLELHMNHGKWVRGVTAGGCRNFPDTFHTNPQFRITLETPADGSDKAELVVALTQKDRRKLKRTGKQNLTIGFTIYKLDDEAKKLKVLDASYFMYNKSVARSSTFLNARDITERFLLDIGTYAIIPSTFTPSEEGQFLLRIFIEGPAKVEETDNETVIVLPNRHAPISAEENASLDTKFRSFFTTLSGGDGEIDAFELQQLLSTAYKKDMNNKDFNLNACQDLVAYVDESESGKLEFSEFKSLWIIIRKNKAVFDQYDKDNSGDMSLYELRDALKNTGFALSNRVLHNISTRYNNKKGQMNFDDFFSVVARLSAAFDNFSNHAKTSKSAEFSLDQYMQSIF